MEKGADKSFEFKMITKFAIVVVFFIKYSMKFYFINC